MALVALHQRMGSHQRKAILVILDRIQGNIPTLDRVATFTIGAKLPTMNIGVAIGAMHTDVLEYEVGVALGAGNLLVHAAQRVACAVVVKLGNLTNGFPARVGVAVLAGSRQ